MHPKQILLLSSYDKHMLGIYYSSRALHVLPILYFLYKIRLSLKRLANAVFFHTSIKVK